MATARVRVVTPDAWPASCVRAHGSEVVRASDLLDQLGADLIMRAIVLAT
jgi:hypothetical protein